MSWEIKKIGEVCDVIPGFAFKSKDLGDSGVPVIKIGNINDDGSVDIETAQRIPEDYLSSKHEDFYLQDNDIVMAMTGTPGKVGIIRCDDNYCLLNQRVAKFVPKLIDRRFLWHILSSERCRKIFYNLGSGVAQPNMSGEQIEDVEIKIPGLEEQAIIADILSNYDDLIENNRQRIALLEQAAHLLYREWFVYLLFPGHEHVRIVDGVPEGWQKVTAYDAMDVMSGGTPSTTRADYWDGDIPFYTPKDYSGYPYVLDTERYITEIGLSNCNSLLFPKDTVFISARGTVGKLILNQNSMAMSQTSYALKGKNGVTQLFLYHALAESLRAIQQRASGAVFNAIVVDTFKKMPFVIPDTFLIEQFDLAAIPFFAQIEALLLSNQRLFRARHLLLPRLMNGEIAV